MSRDRREDWPGPRTIIQSHQNSGVIAGRDVHGGTCVPSASAPPIRILFLGASPRGSVPLRLDEEVREIDLALRQAEFRQRFDLCQQWAVRVMDLPAALLRHKPQIVHFSGHGRVDAICLEDEAGHVQAVPSAALAGLFAVFKHQVRCVVLNSCYSEEQAETIARDIDCVVGMSSAIEDRAAIQFSATFYQALAFASSVGAAFDLACVRVHLDGTDEERKPRLIAHRCDPAKITFV